MEGGLSLGAALAGRHALDGRRLSHAYILSGPAGSGRHALAEWLAACYVCAGRGPEPCGVCPGCRKAAARIHPDIIRMGEDGQALNVAAARALRADAYIRPNEAPRKVYLLERAHELNPAAQNALLKVLEDGPSYAAFVLLTDNDAALLPTVRSRCETVRLAPGQAAPGDGEQRGAAQELTGLLLGQDEPALLAFAVGLEKWDRDALAGLLNAVAQELRDRLAAGGGDARRLMALAGHVTALRRACDFNVGAGHLAGWLAARAGQTANSQSF